MDEGEPFLKLEDLKLEDISVVWGGIDLDTMGRVLRAHLVVEHFIDEALAAEGIDLPRLKKGGVRVMFDHKRKLLGKAGAMGLLSEGVNALNDIRNRFAHNPRHQLTLAETLKFNDVSGHFQTYLKAYCQARSISTPKAIEVVEAFAESAATMLALITRAQAKVGAEVARLEQENFKLELRAELLATVQAAEYDDAPSSE